MATAGKSLVPPCFAAVLANRNNNPFCRGPRGQAFAGIHAAASKSTTFLAEAAGASVQYCAACFGFTIWR